MEEVQKRGKHDLNGSAGSKSGKERRVVRLSADSVELGVGQ